MKLTKYNPLDVYSRENISFEKLWNDLTHNRIFTDCLSFWKPNDNEWILTLDVPGVKREDLVVEVEHNTVYVTSKNQKRNYSFSYTLPDDYVEPDKLTAKLEDGVLTVTVPKSEKTKRKVIELK